MKEKKRNTWNDRMRSLFYLEINQMMHSVFIHHSPRFYFSTGVRSDAAASVEWGSQNPEQCCSFPFVSLSCFL